MTKTTNKPSAEKIADYVRPNNVKSEPMQSGRPEPPDWVATLPWRAAGLVALCIGLTFWLMGARYTLLGAPGVLAGLFGLFGITLRLSLPIGWVFLGLTIVVGLIISAAEFGCYPRRSFFARSLIGGAVLLVVWLIANGLDLTSTYVGVTTIQRGAGAVAQWTARAPWAASLWTVFLSYCPELFILGGLRWLIVGRF